MTIEVKVFSIIVGWIVTVIGLMFAFKYDIKKVKSSNRKMDKVMFDEKEGLNLVSHKMCYERRKAIHDIIDREASITMILSDKVDNLSENIYIMMGAQGLKPKKFVKKERDKKTFYQCSE